MKQIVLDFINLMSIVFGAMSFILATVSYLIEHVK